MRRLLRNIFVLGVLLLPVCASAQEPVADTVGSLPGIEIETSVDKAEAYIGDLITYTLTIRYDSIYSLVPPPLGANLGAFDVKDYTPDVETRLDNGRLQSQTTFVLSTFTTGDYNIPPLPVVFQLADSTRKVMLAEPIPIRILSLLADGASDSLDIKGLKPQYAFPHDYTMYYIWGGAALAVIILAIVLWVILRRKKDEEQVDNRPAWEKAFEKLAFLDQAGLLQQKAFKQYYIELTETARGYLGVMYDKDVLEMTTEQFLETFREVELPGELYAQLSQYFKHADIVKFARYQPTLDQARQDFDFTHQMIEQVRQQYEARQRIEASIKPGDARPVEEPPKTEEEVS